MFRNLVLGGLLSLGTTKSIQAQDNKISASIDVVQSENEPVSFIRPNLFYSLFGLDNYSFFEFYRNEDFFGKTIISKDFGSRLKPIAELVYGSGFNDRAGVGVSYSVPTPNGTSLNVKALPVYFNKNGYIDDRIVLGYYGKINLPEGFSVSAFGEANVNSKDGAQWGYGEIAISKELFDKFKVSYNPLLKNNGKLLPRIEHAVSVNLGL